MTTRWMLGLLALVLAACPTGRPPSDDDDADDDDSAVDDDDATPDDDDATPGPQAPSVLAVEVCQSTTVMGSFGIFEIEVADEQDNLLAPVTYRVQIDGGSDVTFTWPDALGGHGWIDHTQSIGTAPLLRETEHSWTFTVLDAAANLSEPVDLVWTIPADPQAEACGD